MCACVCVYMHGYEMLLFYIILYSCTCISMYVSAQIKIGQNQSKIDFLVVLTGSRAFTVPV